jgi:hypothetical protein
MFRNFVVGVFVVFAACDQGAPPEGVDAAVFARSTPFSDEIIAELGLAGEACWNTSAGVHCLSNSATAPRAIRIGDTVAPHPFDCVRTVSGALTACLPVTATGTREETAEGITVWCKGVPACEIIAQIPGCDGGCGGCEVGDCCCDL